MVMFKVILLLYVAGAFPVPEHLNKSVVSLLLHMLQTDPIKRATAEDIHQHEWFRKDLPRYLFPNRDIDVAIIDHDAIEQVCEVMLGSPLFVSLPIS